MSKIKINNIIKENEVQKLCYKLKKGAELAKADNKYIPIQDRAMIYTSLFAGLKTTEIIKLKNNDVNISRQIINSFGRTIKYDKILQEAISDHLAYRKKRLPNEDIFFFPTARIRQAPYHSFKRWAERAKIPERYSLSSCRHYYIVSLCKSNINPLDVARKVGIGYQELKKYYLLLDKNMNKIIDRDKQNYSGYVYILKNNDNEYKIGCSKNPQERQKDISNTDGILILIKTKYRWRLESFLHNKYDNKKVKGEWFNLSTKDLNDIRKIKNKDIKNDILGL